MPLFGKKDKDSEKKAQRPQAAVSQNETSYFGKNLMIRGRVSGNGNVIILGGFEGEFDLHGRIITRFRYYPLSKVQHALLHKSAVHQHQGLWSDGG